MSSSASTGIGYCHVCDRQVVIDRDSFTCSVCGGGFIELFDMSSAANPPPAPQTAQQQQQQESPQRVRINTIRLNSGGNPGSILPLLFPQLMNQPNLMDHMRAVQQHQQQHQQAVQQLHQQSSETNAESSGAAPNQEQQQQPSQQPPTAGQPQFYSYHYGPGTHLQLIVPTQGEQFDLYGLINNVLSGILDPTRTMAPPTGAGAAPSFQFPPIRMLQLHGDLRDYAWGSNGLDTIITQLLNQLENTGPPPASENQINNLPNVKINQEDVDKVVQCSICMEDFKLDDEAKKLPCKHLFHHPCIGEWLKLHGTCPVCRKNLNGEDTSQTEYVRPPDNNGQSSNPDQATTTNSGATQPTTSTNDQANNRNGSGNSSNPSVYDEMEFD